jgi:hypothetical protein
MLQPGEQATQIVLWEVDDPSKQDDRAFWRDGRPQGSTLAALRERLGCDVVELPVPWGEGTLRLDTAGWGDPERTQVIVVHHRRPTAEQVAEEKARRGGASPFPPDAEEVRQRWLAALEAGDPGAAELQVDFDRRLAAHGWHKPVAQPKDGVELEPGVFLLDARPQPVA